MPSIIAAIKQAAAEITMHRAGTGWRLTSLTEVSPPTLFRTAFTLRRQARIARALVLLGVDAAEAWTIASTSEGSAAAVVRAVMRERARKAV